MNTNHARPPGPHRPNSSNPRPDQNQTMRTNGIYGTKYLDTPDLASTPATFRLCQPRECGDTGLVQQSNGKNTPVKCPNSNHQAVSETGTSLRAHRVTAGFSDTRKQSAHLTRRTGSRTPRQTNLRPRITVELSNHTAVTARVSSSLRRHRSKCCSDLTVSATLAHLTRTHATCFHKGRSRGAVLANSDRLIALW